MGLNEIKIHSSHRGSSNQNRCEALGRVVNQTTNSLTSQSSILMWGRKANYLHAKKTGSNQDESDEDHKMSCYFRK